MGFYGPPAKGSGARPPMPPPKKGKGKKKKTKPAKRPSIPGGGFAAKMGASMMKSC